MMAQESQVKLRNEPLGDLISPNCDSTLVLTKGRARATVIGARFSHLGNNSFS